MNEDTHCEKEEDLSIKKICPNVLSLAQYLHESGVEDDTPIITWDDGEMSDIECEFFDGTLYICASTLSSKNVGSITGNKLAFCILACPVKEFGEKIVISKEEWDKMIDIANQITSA